MKDMTLYEYLERLAFDLATFTASNQDQKLYANRYYNTLKGFEKGLLTFKEAFNMMYKIKKKIEKMQ